MYVSIHFLERENKNFNCCHKLKESHIKGCFITRFMSVINIDKK